MELIERAPKVELAKEDRFVAATLVQIDRAITDEQLEETRRALDLVAGGVDGFPFNFVKFAGLLISYRREQRFDATQAA